MLAVPSENPASPIPQGPGDGTRAITELAQLPIVLYDGQCGLCHRSVRWLVNRDGGALYYAPLQGPTAAALRAQHPEIPVELASVVFVERGRARLRSKAFLYAARHLTRPWRWAYRLRWLPALPLDLAYRVIAHYRYRWFGHYDECRLPTQQERARMLP